MTKKFTLDVPSAARVEAHPNLQGSVLVNHNFRQHTLNMNLKGFKALANKADPLDYLLTLPSVESSDMRFVPEGQRYNAFPIGVQGIRGELKIYVAQVGDEVVFTQTSMHEGDKLTNKVQLRCSRDEFLDLLDEVRGL